MWGMFCNQKVVTTSKSMKMMKRKQATKQGAVRFLCCIDSYLSKYLLA